MRLRKESDDMLDEEILLVSEMSDALAHPVRIRIFRYIYKANSQRQTVCNRDVVEAFDYSQATISQHIKKLVKAGLIEVKKSERQSNYYVNIGILSKYINAVKKFQ